MCVEPELQPVDNLDEFPLATSNTQEGARLDVAMNGFWGGRSERCFVDVCVLILLLPLTVPPLYHLLLRSMKTKRRAYGQRVREVEHALFTQTVLAATAMGANISP